MTQDSRPLSPHLQIYRWQITMALSILHRGTGILLSLGGIFIVFWLLSAASGEMAFDRTQAWLASVPGKMLLLAWSASLFLHLGNGVRHLFWDAGMGFEMPVARSSGWAVVLVAIILTALTWWLATGARP